MHTRRKFLTTAAGVLVAPHLLYGAAIQPWHRKIAKSRVVAGASCTTVQQGETGTDAGNIGVGSAADRQYVGSKFTASATYTVCTITAWMLRTGSPTYTVNASIWSHNAGADEPDAQIGTASDEVAASSVATSAVEVTFANVSANVVSGTTYWVMLRASTFQTGGNDVNWRTESAGAVERIVRDDDGVGPWTAFSTTTSCKYQLLSA